MKLCRTREKHRPFAGRSLIFPHTTKKEAGMSWTTADSDRIGERPLCGNQLVTITRYKRGLGKCRPQVYNLSLINRKNKRRRWGKGKLADLLSVYLVIPLPNCTRSLAIIHIHTVPEKAVDPKWDNSREFADRHKTRLTSGNTWALGLTLQTG